MQSRHSGASSSYSLLQTRTTNSRPTASTKTLESKGRSTYHPYGGIRKGLTIGHDNYADVSAEGLFKRNKNDPQTRRCMQAAWNRGKPFESDQAYELFLMSFYRSKEAKTQVRWAHPKATDNSVHYTVIPMSPFGKITIRWWSDLGRGIVFDFVNLEEQKVVAPHEHLIMKRQIENASWIRFASLEKVQKAGISKDTRFEYPLNADGIVEERWSVPHSTYISLHAKDCLKPFAIVRAPSLDPFPEENIPIFLPIKPEA